MSDLFPLVATVLKDKAAVDAQKEVEDLKKQLGAVKIIRSNVQADGEDSIVFASGQFQDGKFAGWKNLWWKADLEAGSVACSFSDLDDIEICIGGGFPVANFSHRIEKVSLHLDDTVDAEEDAPVEFYFGDHNLTVGAMVKGWPRQEWEPWFQNYYEGTHVFLRFLVENVRVKYPEATFEFRYVAFKAEIYSGPLEQLVPPCRRKKLVAEFETNTVEFRAYTALIGLGEKPDCLDYRSYLDMLDKLPEVPIISHGVNSIVRKKRCVEVAAVLVRAGLVDLDEVTALQALQISQAYLDHGTEEALRVARTVRQGLQSNGGP